MDDGSALRLTTARYYTPNGRSIQAKGIEPDIVVSDGREESGAFPGPMREKDIERHLRGDGEEEPAAAPVPAAPKKEEKGGKKATPPAEQEVRKEEVKDPQLDRAVELLKGWEIFKNRYIDKRKAS
jgi:carboxyl-terminal processing protease